MKKQSWLRIINAALAVLIVVQVGSALLRTHIPYAIFRVAHPLVGFLLFATVVVHLALNWNWVKMSYFKVRGKK